MPPDLIAELAEIPDVVAVKQANPDLGRAAGRGRRGPGLALYAGNDDMLLPVAGAGRRRRHLGRLAPGGRGDGGDRRGGAPAATSTRRARRDAGLRDLYAGLFVTTSPILIKAALEMTGLIPSARLRLPLVDGDARAAGHPAHGPRAAGHPVAGLTPAPIQEDAIGHGHPRRRARDPARRRRRDRQEHVRRSSTTAGWSSSTAASPSPRTTRWAWTSSCPTSATWSSGATSSRRSSSPTATRTTSARCPSCCARSGQVPIYGRALHAGAAAAASSTSTACSTSAELVEVPLGRAIPIGPFQVEFVPLTHSMPGLRRGGARTPRRHGRAHRRLQHRVRARSTAAAATSPPWRGWATAASTCCWPTPRTPRRARRRRRCRRATCASELRAHLRHRPRAGARHDLLLAHPPRAAGAGRRVRRRARRRPGGPLAHAQRRDRDAT